MSVTMADLVASLDYEREMASAKRHLRDALQTIESGAAPRMVMNFTLKANGALCRANTLKTQHENNKEQV